MAIVEYRPPYTEETAAIRPGIFLAGPIQGAPDWQDQAVSILTREYSGLPTLSIFNPRVRGWSDHGYTEQVRWEKSHLERVRELGAIMFWFAAKDDRLLYEPGRAYAQTSRIELGRAFGWKDYNRGVAIALGIEPGYIGNGKYFRSLASEYRIPVYTNLASLCIATLDLLPRQ